MKLRLHSTVFLLFAIVGGGDLNWFGTNAWAEPTDHGESRTDSPEAQQNRLGEMIPVDRAIDMFLGRIEGRPNDVANRIALGRLYLRKAKTGDFASFAQAEKVLAQAVQNNRNHSAAKLHLAQALMARHQFDDALELATQVTRMKPNHAVAWSIVGDCQLELGRYDAAAGSYRVLLQYEKSGATLARKAHLEELTGHLDLACETIGEAKRDAEASGLEGQELAWYELRHGSLEQKRGSLEHAIRHYERALVLQPGYAPAQSALAKALALSGDTDRAIAIYESAIATHGEPPMMWGLGDVYNSLGKTALAEQWYQKTKAAMTLEAQAAAAAHYREFARFCCDTERDLSTALQLAKKDYLLRRDVYAEDLMAWAHFKNGQMAEAVDSIELAMKYRTQDAEIFYHAGRIYEAAGNEAKAVNAFADALKLNPKFSLIDANDATERLTRLQKKPTPR